MASEQRAQGAGEENSVAGAGESRPGSHRGQLSSTEHPVGTGDCDANGLEPSDAVRSAIRFQSGNRELDDLGLGFCCLGRS